MRRLLLGLCVGAYLGFGGTTVLSAQEGSYDESALRLEGHGGNVRIVRGVQGTVVAHIGGLRTPDVSKLVSPSEKAIAEAKTFSHDYGPGNWIAAVGIVAIGAGIGVYQMHDVERSIPSGLTIGGAALIVYGANRIQNAYNALAKSLWWYNRDLRN
jgi:F420-dependent methylenetetrahydromethanopterin dehydrogenase